MSSSTRTTICSPAEVISYVGKGASVSDSDRGLVEMLMPMVDGTIKSYLGYEVLQTTYTHLLPDTDLYDSVYNTPWDLGEPYDVIQNKISFGMLGMPQILQTPEIPLRSITSFYVDFAAAGGQRTGDFSAGTLLTLGTDYYVDFDAPAVGASVPYNSGVSWAGQIRRYMGGLWPYRMRTGQVTYVAGISPDELDGVVAFPSRRVTDIKYAAVMACAAAFLQAKATQANGLGAQGPIVSERIGDATFQYDADSVRNMVGMQSELPWNVKQLLNPHRRMMR